MFMYVLMMLYFNYPTDTSLNLMNFKLTWQNYDSWPDFNEFDIFIFLLKLFFVLEIWCQRTFVPDLMAYST